MIPNSKFSNYEVFVQEVIIKFITECDDPTEIRCIAEFYRVDLDQFKIDHYEEILFALLKK